MNNKKKFLLLVAIFLIQLFCISYISISYEITALTGKEYQFKIEGYDPVDPFRGRYLAYTISTDKVIDELGEYAGKCYITIGIDEKGYAYLDRAFAQRPQGKDYIVVRRYRYGGYDIPFTRYYVNEDKALEAEELFQKNPDDAYIIIRVKKDKSIAESLFIGNIKIS